MATRKSTSSSKSKSRSVGSSEEHAAKTTTDHDEIQRWVEERDGSPACVRGTGDSDDVGLLRIDFPGYSGEETLQHIEWDEFFQKFDERNLAFLYQDETKGGQRSNFNKLIDRESGQGGKKSHGRGAK